MATMPLTNIANVSVTVTPQQTVPSQLNIGLIVGSSTIISAATRTVQYASTAAMLSGGWTGTEPEYLAAQVYFSQSPRPTAVIIGRQDLTATETMLTAVQNCRAANQNWYAVYTTSTNASDITAIAGYIQTASPNSAFFYDTRDSAVIAATAGNVMVTCQTNKYSRTFGVYSSSNYAGAAAMGVAMGNNTGLVNSAFTMAYKSLTGITAESLTNTQVNNILGYNGNVYTPYGNAYNILVQGTMADGTYFDQQLNIDIITLAIQTAIMNVLTTTPKVPYTDAGVAVFTNAISAVLQNALNAGYIAPGVWTGGSILNLKTGDALSNGFVVLADKVANQSSANRSSRTFPSIYCALKMSGAIEHLTIGVNVTY